MTDRDREIFEAAGILISKEPAPADIMDQLDKMRKNVSKEMREFFDDFYEGAES